MNGFKDCFDNYCIGIFFIKNLIGDQYHVVSVGRVVADRTHKLKQSHLFQTYLMHHTRMENKNKRETGQTMDFHFLPNKISRKNKFRNRIARSSYLPLYRGNDDIMNTTMESNIEMNLQIIDLMIDFFSVKFILNFQH